MQIHWWIIFLRFFGLSFALGLSPGQPGKLSLTIKKNIDYDKRVN